jgi:hypothetical protein
MKPVGAEALDRDSEQRRGRGKFYQEFQKKVVYSFIPSTNLWGPLL